jgi:hypothetical protein
LRLFDCPRCIVAEDKSLRRLKYLIPTRIRSWLRLGFYGAERRILAHDRIKDWSLLRRLTPYGADLGMRRGKYIDRFYIEKFLSSHQECIRGRVVEIQSDEYTRHLGVGRVQSADILDIDPENPLCTITLDLAQTEAAPANKFDCIICTQTLLLIYDYMSAIRTLHKMLKADGVLLVTIPGICRSIPRNMMGAAEGDWWRFTGDSARRIFAETFAAENVVVETFGNVLTATSFLHGLVQEELTLRELEFHDPDFEVIIGVKATRKLAQ